MKHTQVEIINALKIIQDECQNASNCKYCPFREFVGIGDDCYLKRHYPHDWIVNEGEPWSAFK